MRKPVHVATVLVIPGPSNRPGPQGPDNAPHNGCASPRLYRIEDYRANIVAAARRGRHYRSIAAQYGINALEVWRIVTDELQNRRAA